MSCQIIYLVVIGNPPYKILTKNNTDEFILNSLLKVYNSIRKANSKNLFIPFIELSIERLLTKKGVLSFIVPEGLFKTRSYEACVEIMELNGSVEQIVSFTDYVFENAVTGNLIFVYSNIKLLKTKKLHFKSNYELLVIDEQENQLLRKIELNSVFLKSVSSLFKGMVVKDRDTCVFDQKNDETTDVFLLGKNISKWNVNSCKYTNYTKIEIIGGTKKKEKHDYYPRILIRRTGSTLCCTLLEEPALTESTLYSCWSIDKNLSDKYLLSLLNSQLLNYYNKEMYITNQQGFPQILMTDLELLPIKIPDNQQPFIDLVDKILIIKESNPEADISHIEDDLNKMVYELYDLSPDEIKIIKG